MKDENDCSNFCPLHCADDQIHCPDDRLSSDFHSFDCCNYPGHCFPIVNTSCPLTPQSQGCPLNCGDLGMPCIKPNEIQGCPDINYCHPNHIIENECYPFCPIHCGDDQILCPRSCQVDGYCLPIMNMSCPLTPEGQGCAPGLSLIHI